MSQLKKHSDEIEEIITAPPRWITRWGVTLVIFLLIVIAGFTVIIRYPDIIRIPVTIRPETQVIVSANAAGVISKVSAVDEQVVKKGDTLFTTSSGAATHYILSPVAGTVRLLGFPDGGQSVSEGQSLLAIRDAGAKAWYAELRGDRAAMKNVRLNQPVTLILASGTAFGQVEAIRIAAGDSSMVAKVKITQLPAGVQLNDDTRAEAEIRLNERSVFERLTGKLARKISIEE
ncbi:MAG TPA: HlyD family efflux transporter periplasmic adaptor subunit [Cyclobacteriaceae bacterium]|nr:HlyD family efflux transporter periplasmic adaptor subunit [Cyclobacteriaceae bacterium]